MSPSSFGQKHIDNKIIYTQKAELMLYVLTSSVYYF